MFCSEFFYAASAAGTTPHFEHIFIGRCYEFGNATVPCPELLTTFESAFLHRKSEDVVSSDYDALFSRAPIVLPANKPLFWSGDMQMAEDLASDGMRFYTLETTSTGKILNGLLWCGSPTSPSGFNDTDCSFGTFNSTADEWYGAQAAFWATASSHFAKAASGETRVLLLGSAGRPGYRQKSFFGSVELPNLNPTKVKPFRILVARSAPDAAPYERCGEGSLALLVSDLVANGFDKDDILCDDDPYLVQSYLCENDPTAPACVFASARTPPHCVFSTAAGAALSVCFGLTLLLLALHCVSGRVGARPNSKKARYSTLGL